jgi:hypothetical protein
MSGDTCSLTIRVRRDDAAAVVNAFGARPDEIDDLLPTMQLLIFDETEPDEPLAHLVQRKVTFDGSFSNGFTYPGQRFASIGGVFCAVDCPYEVLSVPIDLATLTVDAEALATLRAYRELQARVDEHFEAELPCQLSSSPPGSEAGSSEASH